MSDVENTDFKIDNLSQLFILYKNVLSTYAIFVGFGLFGILSGGAVQLGPFFVRHGISEVDLDQVSETLAK